MKILDSMKKMLRSRSGEPGDEAARRDDRAASRSDSGGSVVPGSETVPTTGGPAAIGHMPGPPASPDAAEPSDAERSEPT